jgi:DnaJ-class molecular chaperone
VLIDPAKREQYDQSGSCSLPEYRSGTGLHAAQQLYKQVFGGVGLNADGRAPEKQAAIVREVGVTLEELYGGKVKKLKITRQVLDPRDYQRTVAESRVIELEIKAGWKSGTKLTFERLGDEQMGTVAADMVFVLKEQLHERFRRKNQHLYFKTKLRLKDALVGGEVRLKQLDGRSLVIPYVGPIAPGHQQIVKGEGMPIAKSPGERGDLIVEYEVDYPTELSDQVKDQLRALVF